MTTTIEQTTQRSRPRSGQTLITVSRAEISRHLRRGGMVGAVLSAVVVGSAIGALMLVLDAIAMDEASGHFNVLAVELGAAVAAFIIAVATVFKVGRDNQGQIGLALGLVPRRARLYTARAIGYAAVAAATSSAVAVALCGLSLLTHGAGPTGWALLTVPLSFCGAALLALISFGLTTLVRRSSAGILLFIGVLVILPLAFIAAGMYLPQQLQPVTQTLSMNTPMPHFMDALSASHVPNPNQSGWAIGQGFLGIAAWGLGLALVSWPVFNKQDA